QGLLRLEARQQRAWLQAREPAGGILRLLYNSNPLLPCGSRLLAGHWAARLADLLPALEAGSERVDRATTRSLDADITAFIVARSERRGEVEIGALVAVREGGAAAVGGLKILAQLQTRHHKGPLPGLARWLADQAEPLVATWHSKQRRTAVGQTALLTGRTRPAGADAGPDPRSLKPE
ncbi:MAG: hypothetical protein M3Y41_14910, partial [Pseudomonadota bacterium]|nr:hypothetical protein [Pseudomonadota bacterium]